SPRLSTTPRSDSSRFGSGERWLATSELDTVGTFIAKALATTRIRAPAGQGRRDSILLFLHEARCSDAKACKVQCNQWVALISAMRYWSCWRETDDIAPDSRSTT